MNGRLVRIYITEGEGRLHELMGFLRQKESLRGLTVYRAMAGFGPSGKVHGISLVDLSLDLPLVLEFFDHQDKVCAVLDDLKPMIEPGYLVSWPIDIHF